MRRRDLLGAGLVAATLAACSKVETGTPTAGPNTPAVLPGQARHVLDQVDAALAQAVPAKNARLLGTRVVGPASRQWTARLTVAAARKQTLTTPSPLQVLRLVLPAVLLIASVVSLQTGVLSVYP